MDAIVSSNSQNPVSVSNNCPHIPSLVPVDSRILTRNITPVSTVISKNITNRELVTERLRSLSSSTHDEDDLNDEIGRDMDFSFNTFKTGVDGILDVAGRISKRSKLHASLRIGVGDLMERLASALDLESPAAVKAEADVGIEAGAAVKDSSTSLPDSTPSAAETAATDFAAALPDDPATQIEVFRIILNQLKIRERQ